MKVSGDEAKAWKAVNRTDMQDIGGQLVSADDETGEITYKDSTGTEVTVNLGHGNVRLRRRVGRELHR